MIRNIKTCVIIAGWIAVMGILGGCAVEKEDEEIRTRWNGLKTIVEITSTVDYGNRTAVTKRYYISDEDYPKARTTIYWHEDTGLLRTTCIGCWMLRSKRMHQETMLKFDAVALDILKDVDVLFTKILVKILRIIS